VAAAPAPRRRHSGAPHARTPAPLSPPPPPPPPFTSASDGGSASSPAPVCPSAAAARVAPRPRPRAFAHHRRPLCPMRSRRPLYPCCPPTAARRGTRSLWCARRAAGPWREKCGGCEHLRVEFQPHSGALQASAGPKGEWGCA
jgi:hypothetical protein